MSPGVDYERLARFYDALISTQDDVGFFRDECLRAGGKAVELMAGTGRVSVPLLEAGVDLACVDSSAAMLSILRRKLDTKGLEAPIFEQDVRRLDLSTRFDIAYIAFHSFEELRLPTDQRRALDSVYQALKPGGRFLCTLHNSARRAVLIGSGRRERARTEAPDGDGELALTVELEWDEELGHVHGVEILTRHSANRATEEIERLSLRFALLQPEAFRTLATAAGFEVVEIFGGWERQSFDTERSDSTVWVLKRPA